MKYLKLVNNFDEFAEQAAAGTVFYSVEDTVYYWLNLKSVWGYIGYDSSRNKFITNGRRFSIIPSVPDPESLVTPVTLDSSSFPSIPSTLTIKGSEFNIPPFVSFYGPGSSESQRIRYIVECDKIPISDTVVISGKYVDLVLLDVNLFNLKSVLVSNGNGYHRLVIKDGQSLIDINCLCGYTYAPMAHYATNFNWFCERSIDVLTEKDIFANIPESLENLGTYYNWYKGSKKVDSYPHSVDCSNFNAIKVFLHSLYELSVPSFYPYKVQNLTNLIIDAKDAGGKIDDTFYEEWLGASFTKQFSWIQYDNVTDFGTYYKPYMKCNAQLIPQDVLEMCKTKYVEMFSHNTVTDPTNWSVIAAQNIDLSGIKYFIYYKDGYPYKQTSNPVNFTGYSQFVENGVGCYKFYERGVGYSIVSTPKLSNVNLESYGGFHYSSDSNQHSYVYFNTDDTSINLGTIKLYGNRAKIYLADKDIYISGISQERPYYGSAEMMITKQEELGHGVIHLKHFRTDEPNKQISINAYYDTTHLSIYEMIDVSELVDSENPTALDYYNTGISMYMSSWMFQLANGYITRSAVGGSDFSYFQGSSSKLKCIAGGGWFYGNSHFIATAEDMENLFNAIPNREVSNLTLSFNESQFALLTQEQIDYATGLGYSVVKHIA